MTTSRILPASYNESTYDSHGTVPSTCDCTVLATWEADTDIDLVDAESGEVLTCLAGIHKRNLTKSRWTKEEFKNDKYTIGWRESTKIKGWSNLGGI